jgi:glycosyltransferase involved in cell wall biosynthesis
MRPKIVFLHQNYPAQFGPVARFLAQEHNADITFITQYASRPPEPGIRRIAYQPAVTGHEKTPYFFSRYFEQEAASMHGVYNALHAGGIDPDLLIGHVAFGNMGLLHVAYPDVPKIGFFELFYDPSGRYSDSRPEYRAPLPNRMRVPLRNALQFVELEYCTKGYSPTAFQKSTYPKAYQDKLSVLFDGIDTDFYSPGPVGGDSPLARTWPTDARLVTYVSRGLEAIRGFDIFMKVAHRVSQKRADVHFVVAGNPKTHYGSEMIGISEKTFKDYVLKQEPYDLSRFHFLEWIPETALVDLFRLSDCHFYWTVPFTLSWSLFQALSTGCAVLASDSLPVRDAITPDVNGWLAEPYDIDALTARMLEMLDVSPSVASLRENARQSMLERAGFSVCLPRLADFYLSELRSPGRTPALSASV